MPKLIPQSDIDDRLEDSAGMRTINNTPSLREFLKRPDVRCLRFPSGIYHIWIGNICFVDRICLKALEKAIKWERVENEL